MEKELSLEFLRVVETAAIESARTMGQGDREGSDHAAVEAMRREMDRVGMDGTIVIGEGERDAAPMLFIGEKVGAAVRDQARTLSAVDIAVDPLEGTNLCATGAGGAITVVWPLASAAVCCTRRTATWKRSWWVRRPRARGSGSPPSSKICKAIARRLQRGVDDLVVVVLDRPRHQKLIADIREAGARIRLICDGDLSAGIAAAVSGTGVHAVMGSGGAPEGVLTAAALRCLNGEILARLVVSKPEHHERVAQMGIKDPKRIYETADLAPGKKIIFACTGVTGGGLLDGVSFFRDGTRTHSLIMTLAEAEVRFIDSVHLDRHPGVEVRFN